MEALKKVQATHHIGPLLEGAEDLDTYDIKPLKQIITLYDIRGY